MCEPRCVLRRARFPVWGCAAMARSLLPESIRRVCALTTNRGGLQTRLEHKTQCQQSSACRIAALSKLPEPTRRNSCIISSPTTSPNSPRAKPAFARCWRRRVKILVDFLVFVEGDGETRRYLLDCPSSLEPDLLRRLGMYKLRAAVSVTSKSDELAAFCRSRRGATGNSRAGDGARPARRDARLAADRAARHDGGRRSRRL